MDLVIKVRNSYIIRVTHYRTLKNLSPELVKKKSVADEFQHPYSTFAQFSFGILICYGINIEGRLCQGYLDR
jgi:hypothetical protein